VKKSLWFFAVFSEDMGPGQYKGLARAIGEEIRKGIDGVVIGHGAGTMHHAAGGITEREPFIGYLLLLGGIPEVEKFK
jgi:diacylglycerol kinase family enzyme